MRRAAAVLVCALPALQARAAVERPALPERQATGILPTQAGGGESPLLVGLDLSGLRASDSAVPALTDVLLEQGPPAGLREALAAGDMGAAAESLARFELGDAYAAALARPDFLRVVAGAMHGLPGAGRAEAELREDARLLATASAEDRDRFTGHWNRLLSAHRGGELPWLMDGSVLRRIDPEGGGDPFPVTRPRSPAARLVRPWVHATPGNVFETMDAGFEPDRRRLGAFVRALGRGDWEILADAGNMDEAARMALYAHRRGRLNLDQLTTVLLLRSSLKESGRDASALRALPLLDSRGLQTPFEREIYGGDQYARPLPPSLLQRFLWAMPPSERFAFTFRNVHWRSEAAKVFAHHRSSPLLIDSSSMVQAIKQIVFGNDAVRLVLAFGPLLIWEDPAHVALIFAEINKGGRIASLDFPGVEGFPEHVHEGAYTGAPAIYRHDAVHASMGSDVSLKSRRLFVHLVEVGLAALGAVEEKVLHDTLDLIFYWNDRWAKYPAELAMMLSSTYGDLAAGDDGRRTLIVEIVSDIARNPSFWRHFIRSSRYLDRLLRELSPSDDKGLARRIYDAAAPGK